jgi:hypothetical protein
MIRQAISCDICGAEKKQTNHWFVAYTQGGELRVSGWSSTSRLRAGSKHLCGQTCLHKLIDEFMARTLAARATVSGTVEVGEQAARTDASLTSQAAYAVGQSPAKTIPAPAFLTQPRPIFSTPPSLLAVPPAVVEEFHPLVAAPLVERVGPSVDGAPNYAPHRSRAEAWERERERELHTVECRPDITARRRKSF